MSSGVEASAKKALRDSAWRRFLRGKKRWETKHVSFLAGPRTTEESRKCIGKREGERKNRYYTKFCLLLPYLYSYIWWPFILSEKIIYFFPFSFMAWSTSAFFWSSGSPSNVAPWCFQGIWRREWSNGPKLYDKIPAKAIAGFWGGSYLTVKGANLYTKKAETLQP